jgi:predicted nucleic acid-binding protein
MSVRTFFDTNVLVYAFDRDAPEKRRTAMRRLKEHGESGTLVISTQVLSEFYVSVTRKLARPLSEDDAAEVLEQLSTFPVVVTDVPLVLRSVALARRAKLSYWDAMILQAAVEARCAELLSEDFQAGAILENVRIRNPYAE